MFMLRPRQRGHTPALSLLSISAPTHIGLSHVHNHVSACGGRAACAHERQRMFLQTMGSARAIDFVVMAMALLIGKARRARAYCLHKANHEVFEAVAAL